MIDKKTIKKSLIILSLLIIIIFIVIQIGKTLARYESATTAERDVDIAFWVVDNDFQTDRILIEDIYPTEVPFEYTFSVSNFNSNGKRAETDLEYEITITTTTNLPLNYIIKKNGQTCISVSNADTLGLYNDEDGTYYRELKLGTTEYQLTMNKDTDVTDIYTIQITFPKQSYVNGVLVNNRQNFDYADLMENIKIDLSAKQVIGE